MEVEFPSVERAKDENATRESAFRFQSLLLYYRTFPRLYNTRAGLQAHFLNDVQGARLCAAQLHFDGGAV